MRPLTPEQVARIRELRADGHTAPQVAAIVGCHERSIRRLAPGRIGKVPVAPLREAFLRSPHTAADVARALDWRLPNGHADGSRVKRTLGLVPDVNGHGKRSHRTLADAETVGRIAEVIGLMAWEVLPDDEEEAA